jgi:hypothetical protein
VRVNRWQVAFDSRVHVLLKCGTKQLTVFIFEVVGVHTELQEVAEGGEWFCPGRRQCGRQIRSDLFVPVNQFFQFQDGQLPFETHFHELTERHAE